MSAFLLKIVDWQVVPSVVMFSLWQMIWSSCVSCFEELFIATPIEWVSTLNTCIGTLNCVFSDNSTLEPLIFGLKCPWISWFRLRLVLNRFYSFILSQIGIGCLCFAQRLKVEFTSSLFGSFRYIFGFELDLEPFWTLTTPGKVCVRTKHVLWGRV